MVFHYKFHVSSVSLKVGKINKTTKTKKTLNIDITTLKMLIGFCLHISDSNQNSHKACDLLPPHTLIEAPNKKKTLTKLKKCQIHEQNHTKPIA
jgi:hypothetical protein